MNDLRHAARFLWAHKSFTLTAVLTLAIGLGANTALYGLLNSALKPLPVPDAGQLVAIASEVKNDESGGYQYSFSIEELKDFQRRATSSFSDVFGALPRVGGMSVDGRAAQFFFVAVSDNYFQALRIAPKLGELFTKSAGSPASIVLGHTYWMRHFGGDPKAIGKSVLVNGLPAVITGVVPETFHGTFMAVELDGYVTLDDLAVVDDGVRSWLYNNRHARPLQVFARLRPEATLAQASEEMRLVTSALEAQYPESDSGIGARVIPEPLARPLPLKQVSDVIPLVRMFGLAVAALVLLLACMNVANLLLVRASARQRELAVRAALGATPSRLVRQMVSEGLLLSLVGGMAGLVVGQWVLKAFVNRLDLGADLPMALDVSFDWNVFAFSLLAAIVTGVLIGLWPAWRASRADARAALHDGGKSNSDGVDRQRLRKVLVVAQIAGSLALLIVAGLFVRSLLVARNIDLGFDAAHLASVRMDPDQLNYNQGHKEEFFKELQRRVSALPEVDAVSYSFSMPMSYLAGGGSVFVEGQTLAANAQPPAVFLNRVGVGFFETMKIPIVKGRGFLETEMPATRLERRSVIVNEAFAEKYWPGENPIGKRLRIFDATSPLLDVVGVVGDSKTVLVFENTRIFLYLPIDRDSSLRTLVVRSKGDPATLLPKLEREVGALAPGMPLSDLRTMNQTLNGFMGYLIFRIGAIQAGGMGIIGLILAIVGVYGVVSFGASLRTREIGIRMALGAESRDVLQLILGQGVLLVAIGITIGIAGALGMSRVLAKFLPLVNAADWRTFSIVALGLGALAVWACYLPARRATKIPAATALRHE